MKKQPLKHCSSCTRERGARRQLMREDATVSVYLADSATSSSTTAAMNYAGDQSRQSVIIRLQVPRG